MTDTYDDRISEALSFEQEQFENYTWMLTEDLYQSIMESLHSTVIPNEISLVRLLANFLPGGTYYSRDQIDDVITGAGIYIASNLVTKGVLVLEVVSHINNQDIAYKLVTVNGSKIKIKDDYIIQYIDKAPGLKKIKIPKTKCIVIQFPETLGGTANYLQSLYEFKDLEKMNPMRNYLKGSFSDFSLYNLNDHHKLFQLESWKRSKFLNWHHRGSNDELFSSFYHTFRRLAFKKSRILLRDHVISEILNLVNILSNKLNKEIDLKIAKFVKLEDIEEKIEGWKKGILDPKMLTL